jgi:hypothetical protein
MVTAWAINARWTRFIHSMADVVIDKAVNAGAWDSLPKWLHMTDATHFQPAAEMQTSVTSSARSNGSSFRLFGNISQGRITFNHLGHFYVLLRPMARRRTILSTHERATRFPCARVNASPIIVTLIRITARLACFAVISLPLACSHVYLNVIWKRTSESREPCSIGPSSHPLIFVGSCISITVSII